MPRFTKETAAIYAKRGNINRWAPKADVAIIARDHGLNGLESESRWIKGGLSKELMNQVRLLSVTPCRHLSKLANSPDGEGRASLVARITDTAAKIYGWDNEKGNSLVIIGMVSAMDPDSAPIEVESTPA